MEAFSFISLSEMEAASRPLHPLWGRLLLTPGSQGRLGPEVGVGGRLTLEMGPHLAAAAAVLSEAVSAPWLAISHGRGR